MNTQQKPRIKARWVTYTCPHGLTPTHKDLKWYAVNSPGQSDDNGFWHLNGKGIAVAIESFYRWEN